MPTVGYDALHKEYVRILTKQNMSSQGAHQLATAFADMGWEGTYSHGINRFPTFIQQVAQGQINVESRPECVNSLGALEQWDCKLGPGPLNGLICIERAMEIADQYGVGVVAMKNSNHWMRGGAYALKAARKGYASIAVTNSSAVVPAWGGVDHRIGTNPLIISIPGNPPTLLDMSCSQYSYGALEVARLDHKTLPVPGGYDKEGNLSTDPVAIGETKRILPTGYWKGSALAIVLDMLVAFLADGFTTVEITEDVGSESAVSQLLIAFNMNKTISADKLGKQLERMLDYILASEIDPDGSGAVVIPGHSIEKFIEKHKKDGGMPIAEEIWEKIKSL